VFASWRMAGTSPILSHWACAPLCTWSQGTARPLGWAFRARNLWMVLFYTLGASFVAKVIFGIFAYTMVTGGFFTMLGLQMIPGAALDALVAVPIYLLLLKLRCLDAAFRSSASGSSAS